MGVILFTKIGFHFFFVSGVLVIKTSLSLLFVGFVILAMVCQHLLFMSLKISYRGTFF